MSTSRTAHRSSHRPQLEQLEERSLLSVAPHGLIHTIPFNLAPAAVQTGLDTLATNANLTLPTDSQKVFLGNRGGLETYTIDLSSTRTNSVLTVDQNGKPVTAPVRSTVTVADITNTAVTDEINAIAAALNLNAPASTDNVRVLTNSDNTAVYTFTLTNTSTSGRHRGIPISVDSSGNPTGNEFIPLSALSSAIQNGLTSNAPAGATALTPSSFVSVQTHNGITTYSATFHSTGIRTTVTVDNTGALANLPTTTHVLFSDIPAPAQTELQTLANANGFTGTIADTQRVSAYDEANGTVIYSVRLPVTGTSSHSGATYTYMIAVASDQSGNPTVPPNDGHRGFGEFGGFGGFGWGGWGWGGGDSGDGDSGGGGNCDGGSGSGGTSTTPATFTGFSHLARALGFRF